ncbi:MAG: hypothetical protein K2I89_01385, partial [Muribaculaceae bacterium]|nr:hypothetical protein [Muribaculaceae bacterium]
MDKNTLLGLVLMAACLFGFMYFNKPSEEELARRKAEQEQLAARQQSEADAAAVALLSDSLTASEASALTAAVKMTGAPDAYGAIVLSDRYADLSVDSLGLKGTVTAGADKINIADVIANNKTAMTPEQQTEALANVRQIIARAQKYKSFARHLGGANDSI